MDKGVVSPVIYIDDPYDSGIPAEEAAEKISAYLENCKPEADNLVNSVPEIVTSFEKVKDYLRIRLVNKFTGYEVSKDASGNGFDDLCLVPYIELGVIGSDAPEANYASIRVTKELLGNWNVTAEEAIRIAEENSAGETYEIKDLGTMLKELMGFDASMPDADEFIPEFPMYVVTNGKRMNGAYGVIAMKNTLKEMFPDGYVVLPSSIHECIVIPATAYNADLEAMVRSINETTVSPQDKLSDNVYIINNVKAIIA